MIGPGFRGLVRRTLLLNLGFAISALVMFVLLGQRSALLVAILLLVISAILWSATFAVSSFIWLGQAFCGQHAPRRKQLPRPSPMAAGVRDDWLDSI
jgi:hypothetical protein